ncbi:BMP family ABC transporter substrate-binding protein [Eubacteriales bacterium OttesenSCG-928-N13]|nr:BMP family ABC transporter substrate-binding protein [Eubacteriales bacterium OttesenSCG-928-N13]
MKKLVSVLLSLMLVIGCASAAFALEPISKDEIKLGFVYIGDVTDMGYTYAHHQGTLAMQQALGLRDDQILIKKNISEDSACETALRELVEQGCNAIFATSFGFMDYVEEIAEEYPDVVFSHCSGYKSNDTNFNNYFGRIYEVRYLSGIAAGLKAKEVGNNHLGYVAAFSTVPEVVYSLNAYYLGAKSVNPDVTMTVKVTNSWYDPTAERQTADALVADGVSVISQHCDTTGPVVAAQENGLFAVGYNADVTEFGPDAVLTAPVWHWGEYLTDAVQKVIDGTWAPENSLMGLSEGLVGMADITDNCAEGTEKAVLEAAETILDGSFGVFVGPIRDNTGAERVAEGTTLTPGEILSIDWFVEGITVG